jgi:hypothetical protein
LAPFLPFGIPLFEVALSIVRRLVRGQAVFLGDGDHLHNRLRGKIADPKLAVGVFYFFSAALCALTLFVVLGKDSPPAQFVGAVIALIILGGMIGSISLYNVRELVVTLRNRQHFRFLGGFLRFMKWRIRRAQSLQELLGLLETGVRDLHFDKVEVVSDSDVLFSWTNTRLVHPGNPRIYSEEFLSDGGIIVKWWRPFHDDETYNEYLMLTWSRFLVDLRQEIANQELQIFPAQKNNVIELSSKHPSQS